MQASASQDFKYFTLLTAIYITILLVSVLLDYKFINIGTMLASVATFIFSITFFISDVITEVYGYNRGKKVVSAGIVSLLIFGGICFIFGIVRFSELFDILIISYSFKLLFNTIAVIPATILTGFLKYTEDIDVYDFQADMVPFKSKNKT